MNGYGEFCWVEGKKYRGFFKEDLRDGFGILFLLNDSFYVGFWKEGQKNGLVKYIKGNSIKYGVWKNGKKEKWFDNEDNFFDTLEFEDEKYKNISQFSINDIKKCMEI